MIRRHLLGFLLLLAATAANARDTDTSFTWTLLTDADTRMVIAGAKVVAADAAPDRATLDVVAEVLAERAAVHQGSGEDIDAAAWLAKALAAGHDARYRGVVEQAMAAYGNDKLTKYGTLAVADMTAASGEPFARGTVALPAVRAELEAERKALVGKGGAIATLLPGTSLQTVLETLGYPADIDERVDVRKGAAFVNIRVHNLRLVYPGQGLVDVNRPGKGWQVFDVLPDVPHRAPDYTGKFPDDANGLMTSDSMRLVKLAGRLRRRAEREPALLDRVAERLRVSHATRDEYEASALAHLAHLLADSGQLKYADVLRTAATGAQDGRLKRHTEEALEQLDGG